MKIEGKEGKICKKKLNEQKEHIIYFELIPFWCNGASIEFSTICMILKFCIQIPTQHKFYFWTMEQSSVFIGDFTYIAVE